VNLTTKRAKLWSYYTTSIIGTVRSHIVVSFLCLVESCCNPCGLCFVIGVGVCNLYIPDVCGEFVLWYLVWGLGVRVNFVDEV